MRDAAVSSDSFDDNRGWLGPRRKERDEYSPTGVRSILGAVTMSGFTSAEATILQTLSQVEQELGDVKQQLAELRQLAGLTDQIAELRESVAAITAAKDWYTTV